MTIKSISKKISEEGIFGAALYYICRACSKAEERLIGKWVQKYASVCENRIVFKNRQMQDYTDNARALFDYLLENGYNQKYELIYFVSNRRKFKNFQFKNVKFVTAESRFGWDSCKAYYYGNTAKYFFYTNNTANLNRYHCLGQIVVNLWHGCGYKGSTHANKDIPRSESMEMFDYALVPGEIFVKTKSSYWECDERKILPLGYPRYDWLLDPNNQRDSILHQLFPDMGEISKIIIWMPTFRKSTLAGYGESEIEFACDLPAIKTEEQLQELDKLCREEEIILIVKKHPLQIGWSNQHSYTNIRYITDQTLEKAKVQLYRLVGICDGLLSDYSSIAVDYLLLNRPLGFVLSDFKLYQDKRGFVFENPLDYMPGEKIYDFEGIKQFVKHVKEGKDLYREERGKLMHCMHNISQNYSARLVEFLKITK